MNRKNTVNYLQKIKETTTEYSKRKFISSVIMCFSICSSNKDIIDASKKEMERNKNRISFYSDDDIVGNYYKFCLKISSFLYNNLEG